MPLDLSSIQRAISDSNAQWTAGETELLDMSDEEKRARLGVVYDEDDLRRMHDNPPPFDPFAIAQALEAEGRSVPLSALVRDVAPGLLPDLEPPRRGAVPDLGTGRPPKELPEDQQKPPPPASARDWRNFWGSSYVTPVRNQLDCGSCVAFGVLGAMESMLLINHGETTDLSEAELQFCGGGSCGGWKPEPALEYLRARGVAPESCFPYQPQDLPCRPCSNRDQAAWQVTDWSWTDNAVIAQRGLTYVGPKAAVFNVYEDLFAYKSGIYRHVTGGLVGQHCVEVVGYDSRPDANYWIVKNSWGDGWFGEGGYLRIAFGQCGLLSVDRDDPKQNHFRSYSIHKLRRFA